MPKSVAIVGAGTAGICAARACLSQDLSVTVFDKRGSFGGIWSFEDSPVFDALTTNTACFETCVSDVQPVRVGPRDGEHPHGDNLCLTREELAEYLNTVVRSTPGLLGSFRGCSEVIAIRKVEDGYEVESAEVRSNSDTERRTSTERFDFVIVAVGNFHSPAIPNISGIENFGGAVIHVSKYKNPMQFAGKRVLVVGGSISGCEAVGDMAMYPGDKKPSSIMMSARIARYLMVKQKEHHLCISEMSNRFYNLRKLVGRMWDDEYKDDLREYVRNLTKNEDYNAPPATHPIHIKGMPTWVPVNQKFLQASKQELMQWNIGGVSSVKEDGTVLFNDGTEGSFDAIILATGYHLNLPFLDEETRQLVLAKEAPQYFTDLADHSFHPELPGLAFLGLVAPGSASPLFFDTQARYIARVFAHPEAALSQDELIAAQERYREQRTSEKAHAVVFGCEVLDRFAQLGGFEVDLSVYKEWTKALIFGPIVPAQFRLFGEGKREDALDEFELQMTAAGYVKGDNQVDERRLRQLCEVCAILVKEGRDQKGLREAVEYLCQENEFVDGMS